MTGCRNLTSQKLATPKIKFQSLFSRPLRHARVSRRCSTPCLCFHGLKITSRRGQYSSEAVSFLNSTGENDRDIAAPIVENRLAGIESYCRWSGSELWKTACVSSTCGCIFWNECVFHYFAFLRVLIGVSSFSCSNAIRMFDLRCAELLRHSGC